jgi:hypothetical protein
MGSNLRLLAVLASLGFLTACGGGAGGGSPVPVSSHWSQSAPASMSFFVPSSAASSVSSSSRRGSALPASTQSVQIVVASATGTPLNPAVAPFIFNVSGTAPGCSTVTGGISCTETVTVPFGNLSFAVVAFAGQNASGAAIADGTTSSTIGTGANSVNVTMVSESIYAGGSISGGLGYITVNHSANTFSVVNTGNNYAISGTYAILPNGDAKLVVTSTTDPSTPIGEINYGREALGSMLIFAGTGSTTVQPTGGTPSGGGDLGAAVALQGCPATASSSAVTVAQVAGPAWNSTPTTSPAYTSGTAAVTVSSGTATLNFSGFQYSTSGTQGSAQSGTQVCSGGVFSATSQGSVAISPDGVTVVTNGSMGNVQATDVKEGGFGFVETGAAGSLNLSAIETGTYDGFIGGFGVQSGNVVKGESPYQLQPVTPGMMNACPYSNFEAGTVNTAACASVVFGSQTAQPGVILVTITPPSQPSQMGVAVVGQTSNGKYAIFATAGGNTIEFLQH